MVGSTMLKRFAGVIAYRILSVTDFRERTEEAKARSPGRPKKHIRILLRYGNVCGSGSQQNQPGALKRAPPVSADTVRQPITVKLTNHPPTWRIPPSARSAYARAASVPEL